MTTLKQDWGPSHVKHFLYPASEPSCVSGWCLCLCHQAASTRLHQSWSRRDRHTLWGCPSGTLWEKQQGWLCRRNIQWGWRATSCPSQCAWPQSSQKTRHLQNAEGLAVPSLTTTPSKILPSLAKIKDFYHFCIGHHLLKEKFLKSAI